MRNNILSEPEGDFRAADGNLSDGIIRSPACDAALEPGELGAAEEKKKEECISDGNEEPESETGDCGGDGRALDLGESK